MPSRQTLRVADRRLIAAWAADCAERVLPVFEREAPDDGRLGAAAYAARAADDPDAELAWQLSRATNEVRATLRLLPPVGTDASGPLGHGMLGRGDLGEYIRAIQAALARDDA